MERIYRTITKNKHKGKEWLLPFQEELAHLELLMRAAGDPNPFSEDSVRARIEDLEENG